MASKMKETGNVLVKHGDFKRARVCYDQAVDILRSAGHESSGEKAQVLHTACLSNAALCSLKLCDWRGALQYCSTAIKTAPTGAGDVAKLLYRRGQAFMGLQDFTSAASAFNAAHQELCKAGDSHARQLRGVCVALKQADAALKSDADFQRVMPLSTRLFQHVLLFLDDCSIFNGAFCTCASWRRLTASDQFCELLYKRTWAVQVAQEWLDGCFLASSLTRSAFKPPAGAASAGADLDAEDDEEWLQTFNLKRTRGGWSQWRSLYVTSRLLDISHGQEPFPVTVHGLWVHPISHLRRYMESADNYKPIEDYHAEKQFLEKQTIARTLYGLPPQPFQYSQEGRAPASPPQQQQSAFDLQSELEGLHATAPPLQVFRVGACGRNNKHYGLRSTRLIRQGEYVTQYLGAVLPTKHSRLRAWADEHCKSTGTNREAYSGEAGDNKSHRYEMLVITEDSAEPNFVIDSSREGNLSRFINHSTKPNLDVLCSMVPSDGDSESHPVVCFFASHDIKAGHELLFNYNGVMRYIAGAPLLALH
jgi:hypothetical protein